jgi:hypothetical protein
MLDALDEESIHARRRRYRPKGSSIERELDGDYLNGRRKKLKRAYTRGVDVLNEKTENHDLSSNPDFQVAINHPNEGDENSPHIIRIAKLRKNRD